MARGVSPRHVRRSRRARAPRDDPGQASKAKPPIESADHAPHSVEAAGQVRLQRLIAAAGHASRRRAEELIEQGRVTVNGEVARLGDRADPIHDRIELDGERLRAERPAYWIVHKPVGVVTTVRDDVGRRTVVQLLPKNVGRLFPVGRLDVDTSGLVLCTNDGALAHVLLHPSLGNEREYRVQVKGDLTPARIAHLERGVRLEEGKTSPTRVEDVRFDPETGISELTLVLSEGRNRQIRRSLQQLGHPVKKLARVRMGPLRLGRLPRGDARPLRSDELAALRKHAAGLVEGRRSPGRGRSKAAATRAASRAPSAEKPRASSKARATVRPDSRAQAARTTSKAPAKKPGARRGRPKRTGRRPD